MPARGAVAEAAARNGDRGEVVALPENAFLVAGALPGWEAKPAVLHLLGDEERLPETPAGVVRLLSDVEELGGLPPGEVEKELFAELSHALGRGAPVAATFVGGQPGSFCYAAAETEGLWDVSIDTLEGHRRKGHAASCAAYMIRHMRRVSGKEPVWDALEGNAASMGLAARLGFVPVDRLFVFLPARDAAGGVTPGASSP
jgi:RimJ/RimL family protein N-acetyltransferase